MLWMPSNSWLCVHLPMTNFYKISEKMTHFLPLINFLPSNNGSVDFNGVISSVTFSEGNVFPPQWPRAVFSAENVTYVAASGSFRPPSAVLMSSCDLFHRRKTEVLTLERDETPATKPRENSNPGLHTRQLSPRQTNGMTRKMI